MGSLTEQSWITIKVLINECVFTLQLYLGMWVGSSDSHGLKSTYNGPSTLCSLETPALGIGAKNCVRPQSPKLLMIPWKLRSAPKPFERWPKYCIWILPKLYKALSKQCTLAQKWWPPVVDPGDHLDRPLPHRCRHRNPHLGKGKLVSWRSKCCLPKTNQRCNVDSSLK